MVWVNVPVFVAVPTAVPVMDPVPVPPFESVTTPVALPETVPVAVAVASVTVAVPVAVATLLAVDVCVTVEALDHVRSAVLESACVYVVAEFQCVNVCVPVTLIVMTWKPVVLVSVCSPVPAQYDWNG
jgi:hypothetical protein